MELGVGNNTMKNGRKSIKPEAKDEATASTKTTMDERGSKSSKIAIQHKKQGSACNQQDASSKCGYKEGGSSCPA